MRRGLKIALLALVSVGTLTFIMRTKLPGVEISSSTDQIVKPDAKNPRDRRTRKGPRKPPPASKKQLPAFSQTPEKAPPTEEKSEEELLKEKERKRKAYFEKLDSTENPSVVELTTLGEMAFDANEAEAAYEHYLEVIDNHSDDPMAPFALYKLAWTEFNLGDVEAAIEDMKLVIEWIGDGENRLDETLREEGMKDLDRFIAEAD